MRLTARIRILALLLGLGLAGTAFAQDPPPTPTPVEGAKPETATPNAGGGIGKASLLELFRQANPMLWPLLICSVLTVGYTLERVIALRRNRIIPREFVERFLDRLATGKLDRERATELCRANESPAARIFGRIVHYWGQPAGTIRETVAAETAGELLDLKRNVRMLNGTATMAPLLGLLGTVIGMIEAFDALGGHAAAGTGKSEALAHGISLALMATAFGLVVAIVSVAAYYYLLNKIDLLVSALDQESTRVIDLVASDSGRPLAEARRQPAPGVPADLVRHS